MPVRDGPNPAGNPNVVMRARSSSGRLVASLVGAGLLIAAGVATAWYLLWRRDPGQAAAVAPAIATLFYAGKEAGIPVGIAGGADPVVVGLFIFFADVAFALVAYALVHHVFASWSGQQSRVGRFVRRTQARAAEHEGFIHRYGTAGLFVFMLVPFAFNGPLVGAVLGRLVGLSASRILPTLVAAIGVTTAAWTTIYAFGLAFAARISPSAPTVIAATVVAFGVAMALLSWLRPRMRRAEAAPDDLEPEDAVPRPQSRPP